MSDVLGLDRDMHEAYHALLRERACTAADLCERLGMSPVRAGAALDRLMAAGWSPQSPPVRHTHRAPHRNPPGHPDGGCRSIHDTASPRCSPVDRPA